jgi:hypothetical protein
MIRPLMTKRIAKINLLLGVLLSLMLYGCIPGSKDAIITPMVATLQTTYVLPTTINVLPMMESTQTATPTAIPATALANTKTYVAPTIPTLNSVDARQLFRRMLSQNGGCKLPCWWGITPGETRWADAREMLNSFVERVEEEAFVKQDTDGTADTIDLALVYFARGVPSPEYSFETPGYFSIRSINGIVDSVLAHQDAASRFTLANLLSDLGRPSEVYINTTSASPTGKVPFTLVVDFSNKGGLAYYHDKATIIGDKIYFCAKDYAPTDLLIWHPSPEINQKTRDEFMEGLYGIFDSGLIPLEDTSNMTIEQFYANFRSNDPACIVTLSEKWVYTNPFYFDFPSPTPSPAFPWIETVIPTP